ncbi:uncharacterized protein LOC8067804 isoform X1 [Sorghum bicolor]|uniref:uncharacterized protein LOC8067804 isoform X1 n=1 Tax=Sorghum bicolor TaxID=4558 RepID=UPI000B423927|nr:uncharacterized protein LOC8067804 isoform X1 [Sorghum bicolor]|eukprot:XP_021321200.1 uncharacterized protein LOC8067804 isoform X1 [Sorghum bicolor]
MVVRVPMAMAAAVLLVVAAVVVVVEVAAAATYTVGAPAGLWDMQTDYADWVKSKTFHPGDSINYTMVLCPGSVHVLAGAARRGGGDQGGLRRLLQRQQHLRLPLRQRRRDAHRRRHALLPLRPHGTLRQRHEDPRRRRRRQSLVRAGVELGQQGCRRWFRHHDNRRRLAAAAATRRRRRQLASPRVRGCAFAPCTLCYFRAC